MIEMALTATASVNVTAMSSFTQRLGLSSAMPSINIAYRKDVETTVTKLARGYSHVYQSGVFGQDSELRNSVAAIRNRIMTSSLRMPAGDRKYLLVAKRRLIFTSSSAVVPPFCFFSRVDDRW